MATQPDSLPDDEPDGGAMSDDELAALLAQHEARSVGYYNSEIADEQARAIDYYYGKMDDVPVLEGCSAVVDHTVAVMVDNGLAAILKPFVSAEEVVAFDPVGPEDEETAEQATEYVNYVINKDNPGFQILHDWFKDALLTKIGVVKVWWEDKSKHFVRPDIVDANGLLNARQHPDYLHEMDNQDGTYTAHMQAVDPDGRIKICNVPPEEFLISPFARNIEEAPYVAHRPLNYTRSDLIEMGMDAEIVEDLPAFAQGPLNESRTQARYRDEEWFTGNNNPGNDKSRDIIAVLDEYIRVDYDGDGIAELRRVIRVDTTILLNEEIDEVPMAILCPVPMPHKVYGRSVADQSMEGQKVSTAIIRQTLDNLYKSNNPRVEVPDAAVGPATFDDIGDTSPGAAIRTKQGGQLNWLVVPFTAGESFQMLEAVAQGVEERTGVQRKGNGFNAEALSKNSQDTATEAAIDENSRNERAEMIARIFAETGVKRLFKLILKMLVQYQPKERIIRLRNKFVPMDPSKWNAEMDLTISVGLGMGNKMEQIQQAQVVLNTMAELAVGPFAALVNSEKAYNAVKRLYTASGIKNVDDFIAEPQRDEQGNVVEPQQPPDPQTMKVQAQIQIEQQKLQMKQQELGTKIQLQQAEANARLQMMQQQGASDAQIKAQQMVFDTQLQQARAQAEAQLGQQQLAIDAMLQERQMALQEHHAARDAARKDQESAAKVKKFRQGGNLSK